MFFIITNPMIERFRLPERFACAAKKLIGLSTRVTFPTLNDLAQGLVWHRPEHDMSMIWHHDPGVQMIALACKVLDSINYQLSDLWLTQPALSAATVEVSLNLPVIIPLKLCQSACLRGSGAELFCRILLCVKTGQA